MTQHASIEQRLRRIIIDQLCVTPDAVKDDSNFIEDLGGDSLDRVELVMAIEDEFLIEIPDENGEKLVTVKDAIEYVTARVPK